MLCAALLCTTAAASAGAVAADAPSDGTPPKVVEVKGVRDPELQPYRIMAAGFRAMETHRALAPAITELRFRLSPRSHAPAGVMDGLTLTLEGERGSLPLPLAGDFAFALPRNPGVASDAATLTLNRRQSYIRWLPHMRSPGLAPGMVRLGDARMECQVLVAIVKKMAGFSVSLGLSGMMRTTDWCSAPDFHLPTFSDRRVASAVLLHAGERVPLKLTEDERGYHVPLADQRYGNDDLIEVAYAEDPPAR